MKSKKKWVICVLLMVFGALLVAASLTLTAHNLQEERQAKQSVLHVLDRLRLTFSFPTLPMSPTEPTQPGYEQVIPDYQLDPNRPMPTTEVDGYAYIGVLTVPSLGIELPVMDQWDYPRLKIAPCRYAGTVYQHNMILCAHNYNAHFGQFKNLQPGDVVLFTDVDGNTFHYAVAEVDTLAKTAVEEMKSGGWDLTLFTCTIGGVSRVTVRCEETDTAEF